MDSAKKNLGFWLVLLAGAVVQAADLIGETLVSESEKSLVHACAQGISVILTGVAIFVNPDASTTGILARILKKN